MIIFVIKNRNRNFMNEGQVWDPLRKKTVILTPEEKVRQWFIGILHDEAKVPMHMMMSEVAFRFGRKEYRADIVVYGRCAKPVMAVECKRPEVELTREVMEQILRYNMALGVRYLVITNGIRTFVCEKGDDGYGFVDRMPAYEEIAGSGVKR